MRSVLRRVLLLDHPQETRFFAVIGALGLVLGIAYWFISYEVAGSVLLISFGLAATIAAVRLYFTRTSRLAARRAAAGQQPPHAFAPDEGMESGGGVGGVDRPFLDESGRIPGPTLAPLALGLGISLSVTSVVFGAWLIVAALVPLAWGAWQWLAGARDELDAVVDEESRTVTPDAPAEVSRRDMADSAAGAAPARPAHREP